MKRIVPAFVLLTAASFLNQANATPIGAGQTVVLPPTIETGTLLAFVSLPFTFGPTSSPNRIVGAFDEGVFREADGSLDFAYQIGLTSAGATGNVATFTVADFTNVETDVAKASGFGPFLTATKPLELASRYADASTLSFLAPTPMGAGAASEIAIVRTNATVFDQLDSVTVSNSAGGGVFGLSDTFEPISPGVTTTGSAPETSTWAMMLLGFAGLGPCRLAVRPPQHRARGLMSHPARSLVRNGFA